MRVRTIVAVAAISVPAALFAADTPRPQATPTASVAPNAESQRAARNAEAIERFYPAESLRRGEEGSVKFRVTLNDKGLIQSCAVIETSGYARLDAATCEVMVATARFRPVREGDERIASVHEGSLAWVLPARLRLAAPPPVTAAAAPAANEELVCRRVLKPGSLNIKTKMCLSKADWERQIENAQAVTREMQTPRGVLPMM